MSNFADRLAEAVRRKGNPLCVGIDPRWESMPKSIREEFQLLPVSERGRGAGVSNNFPESAAKAFEAFSFRVLELVAPLAPVVKPQSAFFELCGPPGMSALQAVIRRARELGLIVILDSKRGDIASTATAYADAAFEGLSINGVRYPIWNADALTVNPYLGRDAVEPFITSARSSGRGLFVLVRTSNPGSGLFQDLDCGGRKLYQHVAQAVNEWNAAGLGSCGLGDVGAVVGATHPAELAELRKLMPNVWFLVPGYGAQGGTAKDVAAAFRPDGLGAIVNSSRGITFPFHPDEPNWKQAIVQATEKAIGELGQLHRS